MDLKQPADPGSTKLASPRERLVKGADLAAIVEQIDLFYELGGVLSYREIGVGYEDCNLIITTKTNQYVAKLFAAERSSRDIDRYVEIMSHISVAQVSHPKLIVGISGSYTLHHSGVWVTLAYFIDGQTYYELGRAPSTIERREILDQISKLNRIDLRPVSILNSWHPSHFSTMFAKTKVYLSENERVLLTQVHRSFCQIPHQSLYHALIHGDLRSTNLLVGRGGRIYLLDYFLANYRPRLQELATIAVALFFDPANPQSITQLCQQISCDYPDLKPNEQKYLADYIKMFSGMEFLGANYARHCQDNQTTENTYWLERGGSSLLNLSAT